jgi:hypothetical protein
MSDDETRKMVERLQRAADGYGRGEVAIPLADTPTLYRLPKCTQAGLMHYTSNKAELLLDTEGDHRFVIELDSKAAETLYHLLEWTFKGPNKAPLG